MEKKTQQEYEQEFERYLKQEKHLALMIRSRVEKYQDRKIAVRHKVYGEWEAFNWAQFGKYLDMVNFPKAKICHKLF